MASSKTVHFICRANVFRSRIAQAYLRSKRPDLDIISSGVEATKNLNGSISWEADYLLTKHELKQYDAKKWQQTTQELIDKSDVLIFMASDVFKDAKKIVDLGSKRHEVWEITDILRATNASNDKKRADAIYQTIINKVDGLEAGDLC